MLLEQSNSPQIVWHSNTPHTHIETHTCTHTGKPFSHLLNMTVAVWGLREEEMGGSAFPQWWSGTSDMAVCSPCPPIKQKEREKERKRPTDMAKTDKFELQTHFSSLPPLPQAASMFSPPSSCSVCVLPSLPSSPLLSELLAMRGSHSLCVVISIDLSAVQQPFPADFLSFTLPPFPSLFPLIAPTPTPTHPS